MVNQLRRMRAGFLALVIVVAVVSVSVAREFGDGGSDDEALAASLAGTQDGLCAAVRDADEGDVAGARTAFYARSHDGLHELAARATEIDPAAAARLLEAKQRVEALLEDGPDRADLIVALAGLADATAEAAAVVGEVEVERCGDE